MIEHEIHHRGQIFTYLALIDVSSPPLYGLTSEQVIARGSAPEATTLAALRTEAPATISRVVISVLAGAAVFVLTLWLAIRLI